MLIEQSLDQPLLRFPKSFTKIHPNADLPKKLFSGSGYLTACMAEMVGENGKVVGIDHIPQLTEMSQENIRKGNSNLLDSSRILLVTGDGREGYQAGTENVFTAEKISASITNHTHVCVLHNTIK